MSKNSFLKNISANNENNFTCVVGFLILVGITINDPLTGVVTIPLMCLIVYFFISKIFVFGKRHNRDLNDYAQCFFAERFKTPSSLLKKNNPTKSTSIEYTVNSTATQSSETQSFNQKILSDLCGLTEKNNIVLSLFSTTQLASSNQFVSDYPYRLVKHHIIFQPKKNNSEEAIQTAEKIIK